MQLTTATIFSVLFLVLDPTRSDDKDDIKNPLLEKEIVSAMTGSDGFLANTFKGPEDFSITDGQDLQSKVDDVMEFLNRIKKHQSAIGSAFASDQEEGKAYFDNLDTWMTDVEAFQDKVKYDAGRNVEYLKIEWENKTKKMYQEGMNVFIEMAQHSSAGRIALSMFSIMLIFITSIFLLQ